MVLISIILLLVNAVSSRRDSTIFKNWIAILILLYSGIFAVLILGCNYTGIGIYGGLFLKTIITHSFDLFIYIIGAIVIQFTYFLSFFSSYIDVKELIDCVEFHFALLATPVIKAEVKYPNAEASKTQILKDNKRKSGIYR
jgi:hypothetical protein